MRSRKFGSCIAFCILLLLTFLVCNAPAHAAKKSYRYKKPATIAATHHHTNDIRHSRQYAAIVINANTGHILHHTNAHSHRYPASLTKMMTLYLLFEELKKGKLNLSSTLSISAKAAQASPSKLGLKAKEKITVHDAILALIVKSANDVAIAVAENLAGSEWNFARRMNIKARRLKMHHTTFKNASGLHNPKQTSTAYDLALLSIALRRDFPEFYHLFAKTEFEFRGEKVKGHNRVLSRYVHADGLKTGFINASGFNLATSASNKDGRLVAVVLGGQTAKIRDDHMIALLEKSYAKLKPSTYVAKFDNKDDTYNNHSPFSLLEKPKNIRANAKRSVW